MKQNKTLPTKLIQKERSRFDTSFKNVRKSVQYYHILNEYLIAFFNKYLYAVPSSLLDDKENRYIDAELRTRIVEIQ